MEAQWTVGGTPAVGGAFYSPWYGIETSDNLNLYQPGECKSQWLAWPTSESLRSRYGSVLRCSETGRFAAFIVDCSDELVGSPRRFASRAATLSLSCNPFTLLPPASAVNPWVGDGWEQYIEYYQWSPENNYDSASAAANPGDVLFANVTFNEAAQTYTAFHMNKNSGWSVSHTLPVQRKRDGSYKNYTIACEWS